MTKRKNICGIYGCHEKPCSGGLCRQHYEEEVIQKQRRRVAIEALHTVTVGGRLPDNPKLRDELIRLRKWWDQACQAAQTNTGSKVMPSDEAEYAVEWCISLAQEIVDAELAFRNGKTASSSLAATREWVWNRFKNLKAGKRSNGLPRNAVN